MTKKQRYRMVDRINRLIVRLDRLCEDFDYCMLNDDTIDFRTASRISYYPEHVQHGIEGLREMREHICNYYQEEAF